MPYFEHIKIKIESKMEKKELIDEQNTLKSCVLPNSKSSGVKQHRLSKFQELQRRRLELTSELKKKKSKTRGAKTKSRNEELDAKELMDGNSDHGINNQSITSSSLQGYESNEMSPLKDDVHPAFKKKKLHWGLDSKERWERKANM